MSFGHIVCYGGVKETHWGPQGWSDCNGPRCVTQYSGCGVPTVWLLWMGMEALLRWSILPQVRSAADKGVWRDLSTCPQWGRGMGLHEVAKDHSTHSMVAPLSSCSVVLTPSSDGCTCPDAMWGGTVLWDLRHTLLAWCVAWCLHGTWLGDYVVVGIMALIEFL
jgi:hypothetical protein